MFKRLLYIQSKTRVEGVRGALVISIYPDKHVVQLPQLGCLDHINSCICMHQNIYFRALEENSLRQNLEKSIVQNQKHIQIESPTLRFRFLARIFDSEA